jgi:hypothetical protein
MAKAPFLSHPQSRWSQSDQSINQSSATKWSVRAPCSIEHFKGSPYITELLLFWFPLLLLSQRESGNYLPAFNYSVQYRCDLLQQRARRKCSICKCSSSSTKLLDDALYNRSCDTPTASEPNMCYPITCFLTTEKISLMVILSHFSLPLNTADYSSQNI